MVEKKTDKFKIFRVTIAVAVIVVAFVSRTLLSILPANLLYYLLCGYKLLKMT